MYFRSGYVLLKLINNSVVFGEFLNVDDNMVCIGKPYTYYTLDGGITLAPYDSTFVQGDIQEIRIPVNNILYSIDFKDCEEAYNGYKKLTSPIILIDDKKILI